MLRFRASPGSRRALLLAVAAALGLSLAGCWTSERREVVVYAALDREFSEPILREFQQQTGIRVLAKYDVEATKTVGLTNALLAEKERPRCDLFWNNEILNTLRLEEAGALEQYVSPADADFPEAFRSPRGSWHGFAARARVLLVNTQRLVDHPRPESILALTDPQWRDQAGLAKPLFGTTATHAACLFAVWGDERAKEFFQQVKANARIMAGNKQVALAVSQGELIFGLTDTDDAIIEVEKGMPVEIVYPDQRPEELGTLFIPNTLAIIRGGPHPEAARQLVDFLLSPEVEQRLAAGPSAQIPLGARAAAPVRIKTPREVRAMEVDFAAAAAKWETAASFLAAQWAGEP